MEIGHGSEQGAGNNSSDHGKHHGQHGPDAHEQPLWGEALPWLDEVQSQSASTQNSTAPTADIDQDSGHGDESREGNGSLAEQQTGEHSSVPDPAPSNQTGQTEQTEQTEHIATIYPAPQSRNGRRKWILAAVAGAGLAAVTAVSIGDRSGEVTGGSASTVQVAESYSSAAAQETSSVRPKRAERTGSPEPSIKISYAVDGKNIDAALPSSSPVSAPPTHAGSSSSPTAPVTHGTTSTPSASPVTAQEPRTIYSTSVFNPGDSVTWSKGTFGMTASGNLTVADEQGTVRWSSHTSGSHLQAVFQDDGCLAIYRPNNTVAWSSYTNGHPGAVLFLNANGNVEIREGQKVLWQTGTGS